MSVASRPVARQEYTPSAHLDLRLPALASAPFPSANHSLEFGKVELATDDRVQQSALGIGTLNFNMMSPAENFARRVHRESLPIARLWESKGALLSIGLNKRGKPGLWLTQKTH
jgi:hypothetical protein